MGKGHSKSAVCFKGNMCSIKKFENITSEEFREYVVLNRNPILILNYNIGSCKEKWTSEYLCEKVVNTPVKVHVSSESKLDFINKNFLYKTLPFDELVRRISQEKKTEYFINDQEYYYLRSIGADVRGRDVADFASQYPSLASDFIVPQFFNEDNFFSSVLRLSSAGVSLWTHYDIMDNILIQIKGSKRIVMWPPDEVLNMYLIGDKSSVLDIDNPDVNRFPKFLEAKRYECVLQPGDILFIPALWFHNAQALDSGIAVNVFWRHLSDDYYDKKDPYGNKDLIYGQRALQMVHTGIKHVQELPDVYKDFYLKRMIATLENQVLSLSKSKEKMNIK